MSIFSKLRVVVLGHVNELLDKAIDLDSIPALKQYVRDLEDAIQSTKHESAVATANVTTLTRQQIETNAAIEMDKSSAKSYMTAGNDAAARSVAARIHESQNRVVLLVEQIKAALTQAQSLDAAVENLTAKHNDILSRVRLLESQDRSSKSLERATASLKAAGALANQSGVDSSIDNIADRITSRNDVANVEFSRTMGEFAPQPNAEKDAAIDSILAGLK